MPLESLGQIPRLQLAICVHLWKDLPRGSQQGTHIERRGYPTYPILPVVG